MCVCGGGGGAENTLFLSISIIFKKVGSCFEALDGVEKCSGWKPDFVSSISLCVGQVSIAHFLSCMLQSAKRSIR